jgi:hypothetical protein
MRSPSPRPVFARMHACVCCFSCFSSSPRISIITERDMVIKTLAWFWFDDDHDNESVAFTVTIRAQFVLLIRYSTHILTRRTTNDW